MRFPAPNRAWRELSATILTCQVSAGVRNQPGFLTKYASLPLQSVSATLGRVLWVTGRRPPYPVRNAELNG